MHQPWPFIYTALKWLALIGFLAFIFLPTRLREWTWQRWFKILVITEISDTLSTFWAVYAYNKDWSGEENQFLQGAGKIIGFEASIVIHTLLLIALGYMYGRLLGNVIPRLRPAVSARTFSLARALSSWQPSACLRGQR